LIQNEVTYQKGESSSPKHLATLLGGNMIQ